MHHQLYCVDSPGSAGAQSWESGCALELEPVPLADESRSFVLPTKFLLQLQRGLCQASSGFPYKLQQGSSSLVVPVALGTCCTDLMLSWVLGSSCGFPGLGGPMVWGLPSSQLQQAAKSFSILEEALGAGSWSLALSALPFLLQD